MRGTPHDFREPTPPERIQSFCGLAGTNRQLARLTSNTDRCGPCIEPMARRLANTMAAQHDIETGDARLAPQIQLNIGQQLRRVYADVVDQRVPEQLQNLLRRLDHRDDATAKG
jgi:hypothetical protein